MFPDTIEAEKPVDSLKIPAVHESLVLVSRPVPIYILLKTVYSKTRMAWSLEQILVEIEEYHAGGADIHVDVTVE